MIALLGAMDAEIAELLGALESPQDESWSGFTIHRGLLDNREVIVAKSGVGKTMSALLAQRIIDMYAPSAIVFTGLAGSISPLLEIGDVIVARDCAQHDMDATPLGFKRGEIPYSQYRILPCDPYLVRAASSCIPENGKTIVGRILTGDQFISGKNLSALRYLTEDLEGDAVEMEGASVGLTATVNGIPFLLVRTISDMADGKAVPDFNAFLPQASRNSLNFVRAVLRV